MANPSKVQSIKMFVAALQFQHYCFAQQ